MQPSPWTPTANGTPTQVLLVEDDRRLAELVSDYLHEHGSPCSMWHAVTLPARPAASMRPSWWYWT